MPETQLPTEKQKAFARKWIELNNATEAYRQVYNVVNMQENSIRAASYELLQNPVVINYALELRRIVADCALTRLAQLERAAVESWMNSRRTEGMGARTRNACRAAAGSRSAHGAWAFS